MTGPVAQAPVVKALDPQAPVAQAPVVPVVQAVAFVKVSPRWGQVVSLVPVASPAGTGFEVQVQAPDAEPAPGAFPLPVGAAPWAGAPSVGAFSTSTVCVFFLDLETSE